MALRAARLGHNPLRATAAEAAPEAGAGRPAPAEAAPEAGAGRAAPAEAAPGAGAGRRTPRQAAPIQIDKQDNRLNRPSCLLSGPQLSVFVTDLEQPHHLESF